MSLKKIQFMVTLYKYGGAEKVAERLSKHIGHNKLIVLDKCDDTKTYRSLNFKISGFILYRIFSIPFVILKLCTLKIKDRSTVFISLLEYANFVNIISSLLTRSKSIVSIREHKSSVRINNVFRNFLMKKSISFLYNLADIIVVNSELMKTDLIENFKIHPSKVDVIYNGFDICGIQQLKDEILDSQYHDLFNQNQFLINVGRLSTQKGQWYLIHLIKDLVKENSLAKLALIGEGPSKLELISLCKTLGLKYWSAGNKLDYKAQVYFFGNQDNPFNFIKASKVFLFPSLWEGFPNALVESLIVHTPVVSSNCPSGPSELFGQSFGSSEVIRSNYGSLMPLSLFRGDITHLENDFVKNDWLIEIKYWMEQNSLNDDEFSTIYSKFGLDNACGQWQNLGDI